jgi:hypothetical protein
MSDERVARVVVAVPSVGARDVGPLLTILREQATELDADVEIVVLDNSAAGSSTLLSSARAHGVAVLAVRPPGLATVRNAALDAAIQRGADAVVFVDDDELPVDGWLAALVGTAERDGADVVLGPVPVRLPASSPDWLGDGSVLRAVPARPDGDYSGPVNSGNTLVRLDAITRAGVRFDVRYDATGGEDTVFFDALRAAGARVSWCSTAVAHEVPDAVRLTVPGHLTRMLAAGQRATLVERTGDRVPASTVLVRRAGRFGRGVTTAARGVLTRRSDVTVAGLGDAAFACGSLSALVGMRPRTYGA